MPLKRPRKYRDRRSLKTLDPSRDLPPTPSTGTVTVVEADLSGTSELLWLFSAFWDGPLPDNIPQLEARDNHGSGWISPVSVAGADPDTMLAEYPGADFDDGFQWRVISPPAGLTFAGGQTLIVPEGE